MESFQFVGRKLERLNVLQFNLARYLNHIHPHGGIHSITHLVDYEVTDVQREMINVLINDSSSSSSRGKASDCR